MKVEKPTKELIVNFIDKQTESEIDEVYKYILECKEYERDLFDIHTWDGFITISSIQIDCLSQLLSELLSFQQKTKYDFKILIKLNVIISLDGSNAFDTLNTFFTKPLEDAEFLCLATKFIMYDDDNYVMAAIGIEESTKLNLELSAIIEQEENLQLEYEKLFALVNKIIKN